MNLKIPILSSILPGTPDAFASLPSCLLFRQLFSAVARAGLRQVFSRARVSESRAADERGDRELEGYLLEKGDTGVIFLWSWKWFSVLLLREELLVTGFILQS